jgi:hypothetical protein
MALDVITAIIRAPVHCVGYRLDGTLLALGVAAMAGINDRHIGSITMLAATEAGDTHRAVHRRVASQSPRRYEGTEWIF